MNQKALRSESEILKELREVVAKNKEGFNGYEVGLYLSNGVRGIPSIGVALFQKEGEATTATHVVDRIITEWGQNLANKVVVYWVDIMKKSDEDLDRLRALHKLPPSNDSIYKTLIKDYIKV